MSRSRILSSLAAASLGIALLGACSAESLTERAVGFGLEQAIEGDQDIDLDFSDEGGGFSISTEEGDFAINFDEESGGIVFDTDEGSGVISIDENGIVYDTDEGEGVISFDEDNGTITFDTDEGSGQINVDEDNGTVSFATEDGEQGIFGANQPPANWPSAIGVPLTLIPGTANYASLDLGGTGQMTSASFEHAADDQFASQIIAALKADGWSGDVTSAGDAEIYIAMSKGTESLQIVGNTGETLVILRGN